MLSSYARQTLLLGRTKTRTKLKFQPARDLITFIIQQLDPTESFDWTTGIP